MNRNDTAPVALPARALLRYTKSNRVRTYYLNAVSEAQSELWVVAQQNGRRRAPRKLVTFDEADDVPAFVQEIERELRDGGWSAQ